VVNVVETKLELERTGWDRNSNIISKEIKKEALLGVTAEIDASDVAPEVVVTVFRSMMSSK